MIEIVSLFLGLVSGPQPVELAVGGRPAAVEIRLDGELVAGLTSPPWRFEIDLGEALAPHELVAIARDESGRELDRARRWVNIDMPLVEIDGRAPPGGLTPLPVLFPPGAMSTANEMHGWFLAGGRPLPVSAVTSGPAEVIVVRHPAAAHAMEELARTFVFHQLDSLGLPARPPRDGSPVWSWELLRLPQEEFQRVARKQLEVGITPERLQIARLWRAYQGAAGLGSQTSVRFISPLAAPVSRSDSERHLFAASTGITKVGFFWLVKTVRPMGFSQRIADAVAIAGREAHATGQRRAVVLLLNGETSDESLYGISAVRDYLRALRVPLFTWTLSSTGTPPAWGPTRFIGLERPSKRRKRRSEAAAEAFDRLGEAAAALRRQLAGQRIVLLAGEHLPDRVELAAEAAGARPAGLGPRGGGRGDGSR
jgi:hypothetical protein